MMGGGGTPALRLAVAFWPSAQPRWICGSVPVMSDLNSHSPGGSVGVYRWWVT